MQCGDAGGCAGTARRAVDLTVGEDRDIALVQRTGVRRAEAIDEDRAVDPRQKHIHRMRSLRMAGQCGLDLAPEVDEDRKSTRLNSSHVSISYAVFCLKKKKKPRAVHLSVASRHCCVASA